MMRFGISNKIILDVEIVFDKLNAGERFRRSDVAELLECSTAKATYIMNAMKKSEIIEKVNGMGNGWYRFTENVK